MSTKETIIELADDFIRMRGYNAFSYNDLSRDIGIKTASIHYHFPFKSDLGVAVIQEHERRLEEFKQRYDKASPTEKIAHFLDLYTKLRSENKICLVASLTSAFNTIDDKIQQALQQYAENIIHWLSSTLAAGKKTGEFAFSSDERTKALMIITNIQAITQLSRITSMVDFEQVKETILKELKPIKK